MIFSIALLLKTPFEKIHRKMAGTIESLNPMMQKKDINTIKRIFDFLK